jgi:hypothetical protein
MGDDPTVATPSEAVPMGSFPEYFVGVNLPTIKKSEQQTIGGYFRNIFTLWLYRPTCGLPLLRSIKVIPA